MKWNRDERSATHKFSPNVITRSPVTSKEPCSSTLTYSHDNVTISVFWSPYLYCIIPGSLDPKGTFPPYGSTNLPFCSCILRVKNIETYEKRGL